MMDECVENNRGKEFSAPGKADCENHQDGSEVKPSDKVVCAVRTAVLYFISQITF